MYMFNNKKRGDRLMLKADGYDDCILGEACIWREHVQVDVLVYSADQIIAKLIADDGMSDDEAREYYYFNIEGAYVGLHTPVFVFKDINEGEFYEND